GPLRAGGGDGPPLSGRGGRARRGRLDPAGDQRDRDRGRALPRQPGGRPRNGAGGTHAALRTRRSHRGGAAPVIPLQAVAIGLVALGGLAVVAARDPLRQALVLGVYGLTLVVLFVVLQAPDVALSELVVSTVAFPFI